MDNNLGSNQIRDVLDDEISDLEDTSDIDVPELDSDVSLEDYSSGSGEEYVPNFEDLESSEVDISHHTVNNSDSDEDDTPNPNRPIQEFSNPFVWRNVEVKHGSTTKRRDSAITLSTRPLDFDLCLRMGRGTINKNSKGLPKSILSAKLGERESIYFRKKKLLLVKYQQKKSRKPVLVLTSACHAEDQMVTSKKGLRCMKPLENTCCGPTTSKRSRYWCPQCNCGIHKECFSYLDHYPRPLKSGRKRMRPNSDSELLDRFQQEGEVFLKRIITCDETWVHHTTSPSKKWQVTSGGERMKVAL
ncbi:hypothetical protein J6590_030647 [Homalodisca vitripennis]|nr:hypothetical protein J6590_030647 [Homalodisca vitripennis]